MAKGSYLYCKVRCDERSLCVYIIVAYTVVSFQHRTGIIKIYVPTRYGILITGEASLGGS